MNNIKIPFLSGINRQYSHNFHYFIINTSQEIKKKKNNNFMVKIVVSFYVESIEVIQQLVQVLII